jgi:hypothetical protein
VRNVGKHNLLELFMFLSAVLCQNISPSDGGRHHKRPCPASWFELLSRIIGELRPLTYVFLKCTRHYFQWRNDRR